MRRSRLLPLGLMLTAFAAPSPADDCLTPGDWWQHEAVTPASRVMAQAAAQDVVLIGEHHDQIAHHRFELATLAGLAAHRDDMVIGLEMLPRSAQPVLDAWVAGKLSEAALLRQSRWDEVWGFEAAMYLPIFHFARMNRLPLIALNIAPELRRRLADDGFDAVPAAERHDIAPPAAPTPAYRQRLRRVYDAHPLEQPFATFLRAQLAWDAAMADALARASAGGRLAVGLMGTGHMQYNDGVAHQLAERSVQAQMTLMPLPAATCRPNTPAPADAVYLLEAAPAPDFMERLGVD
ncbi:ChaN family lipoprotein [Halomonas cibimaris]|uniref:ChaN family lipoprotein n=1 Tax=Halomonas cibimaris TaxID=657012 RepID=A0ABP7LPG1_9GAMM